MTPEALAAKLRAIGQAGVTRALHRTMVAAALIGEGAAKDRASTVLQVRTGHLVRSIAGKVRQGPEGPEAVISAGGRVSGAAPVVYAGTHEYGATITPKRGKYLRIPLAAAKTQAGVDRYPTPLRVSGAGLFYVRKSKAGRLLLIHKPTGAPWYMLVPSVTIRARPFLRPGAQVAADRLPAQFAKHLKAEIEAAQ